MGYKVRILMSDREFVKEISSGDFNNFEFVVKRIKEFEKIYSMYRITLKSSEEFKSFILQKEDESVLDLDELMLNGLDRSLKYIMFSRAFFENLKSYDSDYVEIYNAEEEVNKYFKILRLLRNYAQHYSIPVSDVSHERNLLTGKTTSVELYIKTTDLLMKNFKAEDVAFIETEFPDKIILNELIEQTDIVLQNFFEETSYKTYNSFKLQFISFHNSNLELMMITERAINGISHAEKIHAGAYVLYDYHQQYMHFDRSTYELFLNIYREDIK